MNNLETVNNRPQLALLIDGENISSAMAGRIIVRAGRRSDPVVKRVYGDASAIPGWQKAPGFRFINTGVGKNSANMMLAIQAVDFAHSHNLTGFVIVSSDGDFSHLAHFLREKGFQVYGIGETKAPERFRKACGDFDVICSPSEIPVLTPDRQRKIPPEENAINQKVADLIKANSNGKGMNISLIGGMMGTLYKVKISERAEKNWRAYLVARPDMFSCDPKGANACVRLK